MSGENWGAFEDLARFQENMIRTHNMFRDNDKMEAAWRKVYGNTLVGVEQAQQRLVRSILNPPSSASSSSSSCWGFKEIRFGFEDRNIGNFANDVEFLKTLCSRPKIVLHTRRNLTKELLSSVLRLNPHLRENVRLQHDCFDSYSRHFNITTIEGNNDVNIVDSAISETKCLPNELEEHWKYRKTLQKRRWKHDGTVSSVYRHYLEDYTERNANFFGLWKFLECTEPVPGQTISKVEKPQQ